MRLCVVTLGPNIQDAPWGDQGHVVVETVAKAHAAPHHSALPKDASKVVVQGLGTEQAALNRETQFNVDASNAGTLSGSYSTCSASYLTSFQSNATLLHPCVYRCEYPTDRHAGTIGAM